jgi:hypothetical protein
MGEPPNDGQGTNDKRALTKDDAQRGGLIVVPLSTPPKRYNLMLGLGGGGGRIRSSAERKGQRQECNFHEVDDDNDEDNDDGGGKGGSEERNINDSISLKCIVTLFTLSLYFIPINKNFSSVTCN